MGDFGDRTVFFLVLIGFLILPALKEFYSVGAAQPEPLNEPTADSNLKGSKIPLKTDDEVLEREEQALSSDGYSIEEQRLIRAQAERYPFQAEVNRVMSIIINSLYSNKDIFLRELISNASDALDKIRFLSLTDPSQLGDGDQSKLEIKIKADPQNNVLHITDTGIGMTKDDLITKLGTIAKSGTREFIEAVKTSDMNLIGQFGVGFYSAFLVADSITVTTKSNSDPKQWIWKSTAESSFTITEDPQGPTLGRGTRITLHLKNDCSEYLDNTKLEALIKRYSEFINFPIYVWSSQEVSEPESASEDTTEEVSLEEKEDKFEVTEEEADQKPSDSTKKKTKTVYSWKLQNENKPIWLRNPKEVTEEEYNNFYKSFSKDSLDPLAHLHFSGEGEIDFKAILYIPAVSPTGLFDPDKAREHRGLRLYVKRVFITDDFSEMLPRYLTFIKGMVDSENLPLNVSREILQQDRTLSLIRKKLVRKIIAMIQTLAEDTEKYEKFWEQYGTAIKLGVADDQHNKTRLSKLLRFYSSKTKKLTSLEDYVSRMKEGQTQIYYLAGESQEAVSNSPFVEKLLRKGYEVLYMTEPIDEWSIQSLNKFDNKYLLTNVAKEGLKLDGDKQSEEEKQKEQELNSEFKDLLDFLKSRLENKVSKAVISHNLVKTPSAITSGLYGFTANMERLMKAQAFADQKQFAYMKGQRVLEINPRHPIIVELNRRVKNDPSDPIANDLALLLYDTASLHSGYSLDDAPGFANRIHTMMKLSLNLDKDAEAEIDPNDFSSDESVSEDFSQPPSKDEL